MKKLLGLFLALFPFFQMQGEIKALIFDYGNVLMRFKSGKSPSLKFICDTFGSSGEEVLREIKKDFQESLVAGGCEEEKYWQTFAANLNVSYPENWVERWQTFHLEQIEFNEELFTLIDTLKAQGYTVGLLSNQVASLSEVYQKSHRLDPFDPLILSWEVKVAKPDLAIYHILLKEIDLKPEEILFIDDKEENLQAARALDIQTIYYDYNIHEFDTLLTLLKEYEIKL
ncbi:MAG: HAD family hydrolase [Simkaniaceae bacterium]